MALKNCRECGKKVSTEAATCPSCGVPNPTLKKMTDYEKRKQAVDEYYSKGKDSDYAKRKQAVDEYYSSGPLESFKKGFYGREEYAKKKAAARKFQNISKSMKPDGRYFFNGTESLAVTFWGYFIGANVVINLFTYAAGGDDSGVIILLTIFWIIWNVLAIMGVFNAADIYKAAKIKNGDTYGYATAAKIASVILILSAIGNSIPK